MDAVFGVGPLARTLAAGLGRFGTVLLVGPNPARGPFFWRRGDALTGEAVVGTLRDARRAFVVVEQADQDIRAFFNLLMPGVVQRGVLVLPLDAVEPKELKHHADWSIVRCAPVLGPGEPLIDAWAAAVARQQRVLIANVGTLRPVAMADAVSAIRAAAGFRGLRWTVAGEDAVTLYGLVDSLAETLEVPTKTLTVPLFVAMRAAGQSTKTVRAWAALPEATWHTPGWTLKEPVGRRGWLGDPALWPKL